MKCNLDAELTDQEIKEIEEAYYKAKSTFPIAWVLGSQLYKKRHANCYCFKNLDNCVKKQ